LTATEVDNDLSMNMKSRREDADEQKEKTRELDELDKISFHPCDYRGYNIIIKAASKRSP